MSEEFVPFAKLENLSESVAIRDLFQQAELPIIRLNGNMISCFQDRPGKPVSTVTYSPIMLAQHLVFMLGQPTAKVGPAKGWVQDGLYRYKTRRVTVPAYLSGTSFSPVYIRSMLPEEYNEYGTGFLEAEQLPAVTEVNLDPAEFLKENGESAKHFAYWLCLPGSKVFLVTDLKLRTPCDRNPL